MLKKLHWPALVYISAFVLGDETVRSLGTLFIFLFQKILFVGSKHPK